MAKYSKQFKNLMPTIAAIASYIETKAGGTVFPSDDKDFKAVNFRWKKFDMKAMNVKRYNYKLPYDMLESAIEPMTIAKDIVDKIEKGIEDG